MKKYIAIAALSLLTIMQVQSMPMNMELGVAEQTEERVKIMVEGNSVLVNGAQGETLEIVSLTGRLVSKIAIDNASQRIELNLPKGCYILKIGKVVRKVSVH